MQKRSFSNIILVILLTGLLFTPFIFSKPYTAKEKKNKKSITATQSYGKVSIKTWADGKKSAYSFSFDDGFMSQYTYARPILNKFGFHGTFYLIAAGALADTLTTTIYRYGYWWQFREMAKEGHEMGAHTMTHPHLTTLPVGNEYTPNTITYELYQSKKIIQEKIPDQQVITLAYPYCDVDSTVIKVASKYFEAARGCSIFADGPDITGSNWYNLASIDVPFSKPRNQKDDLKALTKYENKVLAESIDLGKWTILMGHEIFPFSKIDSVKKAYYPMSTEWFTALCEWIKQKSDSGELWVETVGNVTRYIKERENFYYNPISQNNNKIEIEPLDGLNILIYNYPLTADITVPSSWDTVTVVQGGKRVVTKSFIENNVTVIRAKIIPQGGIVTITPGTTSGFTLKGEITYDNSSNTPIKNVIVALDGMGQVRNTLSDSYGNYQFTNLIQGSYKITFSKSEGWGGVNNLDILTIQKYLNNRTALDSLQKLAADVNNDGIINSSDDQMIKERFLGKISSYNKLDWIFPEEINITISDSSVTENIKGIAAGDVNRSFVP